MHHGSYMLNIVKDIKDANCITHSGKFHADEIMATVILNKIMPVNLLRVSEVPKTIKSDIIVFDIGGGKFDHHQKNKNGYRKNGLPYASAGLIWKEFGINVIKKMSSNDQELNYQAIFQNIDQKLIQGIDAIDNGVPTAINFSFMHISKILADFNPSWEDTTTIEAQFQKAFKMCQEIFDNCVKRAISKEKSRIIVEDFIEKSSDNILILDYFLPWNDHLLDSKNPKAKNVLYCIFPSDREGYIVQAICNSTNSLDVRKRFPKDWWGLNRKDLPYRTNIKTALFCHPKGFIAGAKTLDDAIKMAHLAINA